MVLRKDDTCALDRPCPFQPRRRRRGLKEAKAREGLGRPFCRTRNFGAYSDSRWHVRFGRKPETPPSWPGLSRPPTRTLSHLRKLLTTRLNIVATRESAAALRGWPAQGRSMTDRGQEA